MKRLSLGTAFLATAILANPALAEDKIVAANWAPPGHITSVYQFGIWAERAQELAGGELVIEAEVGSARISPGGAMQDLADGLADVSFHVGQYTLADVNISNATEEMAMYMTDSRVLLAAAADFEFNNPLAQEQWARNGVVYIGPFVTAPYVLVCNKKVSTFEEFQGARVRMPGRAPSAWVNEAGGTTVALNANEAYGALDKGALDCTTATPSDVHNRKIHEVANHVTEMPITRFWSGYGWAANPDSWAGLSDTSRRAMLDAAADTLAVYWVDGIWKAEVEAKANLIDAGVQFHAPDQALQDTLTAFLAHQAGDAEGIAKEKFMIADPAALFADFQGRVAKWEALLADVAMDDADGFAALLHSELFDKVDASSYGVN